MSNDFTYIRRGDYSARVYRDQREGVVVECGSLLLTACEAVKYCAGLEPPAFRAVLLEAAHVAREMGAEE